MNRICVICGKEFAPRGAQITCGKECSIINKKEKRKITSKMFRERQKINRGRKASNIPGIVEISKKARLLGMSYGEYVAYMDRSELK